MSVAERLLSLGDRANREIRDKTQAFLDGMRTRRDAVIADLGER
jgi:hypothetical protein